MALPAPNPGGGSSGQPTPVTVGPIFQRGQLANVALIDKMDVLISLTQSLLIGQAEFLEEMKQQGLEAKDLAAQNDNDPTAASGGASMKPSDMLKGLKLGFGDILMGALVAYAFDLEKYIRAAFLPAQLMKPVVNAFKAVFSTGPITKALKSVEGFFDKMNKALAPKNFAKLTTAVRYFMVPFTNVVNGFKMIGKDVQAFGKTVKLGFKDFGTAGKIGATIKSIFEPFAKFFKFLGQISGITATVGRVGGMFAKVMPILKGIASKLLLPLFAIFDFVTGFIEGFSSKGADDQRGLLEKMVDGLLAGVLKTFKGIFIAPLDILKDIVSWAAEKLGFENFSKMLDSFSFSESFDQLVKFATNLFSTEPEDGYFSVVKFVMDGFNGAIDYVKGLLEMDPVAAFKKLAGDALTLITAPHRWIYDNAIKPAIDGIISLFGGDAELPSSGEIGDMAGNFIKGILKSVLPDPNSDNIFAGFAAKAIPDAIYEYAGIDPKTGKDLPGSGGDVGAASTGAKEAGEAAAAGGGGNITINDNSDKSTNSTSSGGGAPTVKPKATKQSNSHNRRRRQGRGRR